MEETFTVEAQIASYFNYHPRFSIAAELNSIRFNNFISEHRYREFHIKMTVINEISGRFHAIYNLEQPVSQ